MGSSLLLDLASVLLIEPFVFILNRLLSCVNDVEIVGLEFDFLKLETLPLDFAWLLVKVHGLGTALIVVVTAVLLVVDQDVVLLVVGDNLRVRSIFLSVVWHNGRWHADQSKCLRLA